MAKKSIDQLLDEHGVTDEQAKKAARAITEYLEQYESVNVQIGGSRSDYGDRPSLRERRLNTDVDPNTPQ